MKRIGRFISKILIVVLLISSITTTDVMAATTYKREYNQKVNGVTEIYATSTQPSTFYVYTSWFKYKTNKPYKTYSNIRSLRLICNLSNTNHYYVKIESTKRANTSCVISQYLDKKKVSNRGIKWIANSNSGVPSGSIIYRKKLYFSKYEVAKALEYIDNNKLLDYQTRMVNLYWFASSSIISSYLSSRFIKGLFWAISGAQTYKGIDFRNITKSQVKKASGYTYNSRTTKGYASRGVLITVYIYNGMEMVSIEPWNGVDVSGKKGYIGKWSY